MNNIKLKLEKKLKQQEEFANKQQRILDCEKAEKNTWKQRVYQIKHTKTVVLI